MMLRETLRQDLRLAGRRLLRNRAVSFGIIVCLALGIGATTAIFSVVQAVLLRPLPFPEAARLAVIFDTHRAPGGEMDPYQASPRNFTAWRQQSKSFEQLAASRVMDVNLTGEDEPERLKGGAVTAGFFSLLGVEPLLGRTFDAGEDQPGAPAQVVILSHGLWQRRFGGDRGIVGRSLVLDGRSHVVVGVMPPGLRFPEGVESLEPRDLWLPLGLDSETLPQAGYHFLVAVARLRPGVSMDQAASELQTIAGRLARDYPDTNADWGVRLTPLREAIYGQGTRPGLLLLLLAGGFVLLIACANVASMLLARAVARGDEFGLRRALGAPRRRLIGHVLTESLLLALLGGVGGLLLAFLGTAPLAALSPLEFPTFQHIRIDWTVLSAALALSLISGVLFGIAPALRLSAVGQENLLVQGSSRTTVGRWGRRLQATLVVAEIALVVVLLVGAGLLLRSFQRLRAVDPGFIVDNVLTLRLGLSAEKYPEAHQQVAYAEQIVDRVRALPGVLASGVVSFLPIGDPVIHGGFTVENRPLASPNEILLAHHRQVDPGYFETLGLRMVEGRPLTRQDHAAASMAVVVSRELARQYWPGQSALGKRVKRGGPSSTRPWMTVVGVTEDVRDTGLNVETGATWYLPYAQHPRETFRLVVRTAGEPESLLRPVREAIWSIDPDQSFSDVTTVRELVAGSLSRQRFNTLLLGLFAGLGLVLATLGVYGVMSYTTGLRTHEVAIRMALGARRHQVLRGILGQGMAIAGVGLVVGLLVSYALRRSISAFLFEVKPTDPATLIVTVLFLAVVAGLAVYVPARRAALLDPMNILRAP